MTPEKTIHRILDSLDEVWAELDANSELWLVYRDEVRDDMDRIEQAANKQALDIEIQIAQAHKRRNRAASPFSRDPSELRQHLWNTYPHQCQDCGMELTWEIFALHHAVEVSKGGTDDDDNIRMLCHNCHAKYGNGGGNTRKSNQWPIGRGRLQGGRLDRRGA